MRPAAAVAGNLARCFSCLQCTLHTPCCFCCRLQLPQQLQLPRPQQQPLLHPLPQQLPPPRPQPQQQQPQRQLPLPQHPVLTAGWWQHPTPSSWPRTCVLTSQQLQDQAPTAASQHLMWSAQPRAVLPLHQQPPQQQPLPPLPLLLQLPPRLLPLLLLAPLCLSCVAPPSHSQPCSQLWRAT